MPHRSILEARVIPNPLPLSSATSPNLTGPIPTSLSRLSNLTSLSLSSNDLSGRVPSFLASLRNLYYINLSRNCVAGPIPPGLPSLLGLTFLRLDRNRLNGSIPISFGALRSRSILYLSHNRLSDPMPWSLGHVDFKGLDLGSNSLSGDASFLFRGSNTTFAKWIDLSNNKLEFDLGRVQGFPLVLRDLDVSRNRIYGSIPWQIVELRELWHLNVSYNMLCGKIPIGGNMGRFGHSSYLHNRCLCGTPLHDRTYRLGSELDRRGAAGGPSPWIRIFYCGLKPLRPQVYTGEQSSGPILSEY